MKNNRFKGFLFYEAIIGSIVASVSIIFLLKLLLNSQHFYYKLLENINSVISAFQSIF